MGRHSGARGAGVGSVLRRGRHSRPIDQRKPKATVATAIFAVVALFGASVALADQIVPDGDGDEIINHSDLAMGDVCATTGEDGINGGNDQVVDVYLRRQGNTNTTAQKESVWENDTEVTVEAELHENAPDGLSVSVADPGFLTTPEDWTADNAERFVGPLASFVRVERTTLGALPGTGPQRKITYSATGTNMNSNDHTHSRDVEVTATIVDEDTPGGTVDCTLPTVSITTPAAGVPQYEQGATVNVDFACADEDSPNGVEASGVDICDAVVVHPDLSESAIDDDDPLPTAVLGTYTVRVTAVDNAGNVATGGHAYEVVEPAGSGDVELEGFYRPVDMDVVNVAKAGQAVALKWRTKVDGQYVGAEQLEDHKLSLRYATPGTCNGTSNGNDVELGDAEAAGQSGLRWDEEDEQYVFALKSSRLWAGLCLVFEVEFDGGESLEAAFYFRR